jgi:hypothetical protein
LECLGYNLIYWSQGFLPWKDEKLKEQPEIVQKMKEIFMTDVKVILKLLYGKEVPRYLGAFMDYVNKLEFDEEPNYVYLKSLFEKELVKLGFKKTEMKLSLSEIRDQCQPAHSLSENELMSTIVDVKNARKLGFLIATDCVDGFESQLKPNESFSLNASCKASPKNLRSKEKLVKGKRPKRTPKVTEKELISEKMAQGKKLSLLEIATLDPDQISRTRADREYEKLDDKVYYQTPHRYKGNPTYAILEIQERLKSKHNGSAVAITSENFDVEPLKAYTKTGFKKQQKMADQFTVIAKTSRRRRKREEVQNDVIKPVNIKSVKTRKKKLVGKKARDMKTSIQEVDKIEKTVEIEPKVQQQTKEYEDAPVLLLGRKARGRPRNKQTVQVQPEPQPACDDTTNHVEEIKRPKRKRAGKRVAKPKHVEPPETEEDSDYIYFDIPGEGSNDGLKDISENENEPEIFSVKRSRRITPSDDNSNQESVASGTSITRRTKQVRGKYEADDDYEADIIMDTDESNDVSSESADTKLSSESFNPRRVLIQTQPVTTRNKVKSRSTSRSAAFTDKSYQSESDACDESEYQAQSDSEEDSAEEQDQVIEYDDTETEEEEDISGESEMADSNDESDDSIDIKMSPIKTRTARRRITQFSVKQMRGKEQNQNNHTIYLITNF